jgi:hypothetical protein
MPLGHILPLKVQAPVEATSDQWRWCVLECVSVYNVDDWSNHRVGLLLDTCQHRLQPVFVHLDVAVQKDNHLTTHKNQFRARKLSRSETDITSCFSGSKHPGPDQPLSTGCFGDSHNGQIFYTVGYQLIMYIVWKIP